MESLPPETIRPFAKLEFGGRYVTAFMKEDP